MSHIQTCHIKNHTHLTVHSCFCCVRLSKFPCTNVTKFQTIYCTVFDWQALTGWFVWGGLTLFQCLFSSSLWKRANSWMLVSSFHSSNKTTPSITTETDNTAVIRITFGPGGHSLETEKAIALHQKQIVDTVPKFRGGVCRHHYITLRKTCIRTQHMIN